MSGWITSQRDYYVPFNKVMRGVCGQSGYYYERSYKRKEKL